MQIGGLISCSPGWVSSGLGLPPALPGLKPLLAGGTDVQPDGGLGRQGWPVALAAEGLARTRLLRWGNRRLCSGVSLALPVWGTPGCPRACTGPCLTWAPTCLRVLPAICWEGPPRPGGIHRGGSWTCALGASQAAVQMQAWDPIFPLLGGGRGESFRTSVPRPLPPGPWAAPLVPCLSMPPPYPPPPGSPADHFKSPI